MHTYGVVNRAFALFRLLYLVIAYFYCMMSDLFSLREGELKHKTNGHPHAKN